MDGQHFFIHSSVDGHCGCFHVGAVMNPVNIRVQDSVRTHAVSSWSGGAESHCNSCDFLFNILWNCQTSKGAAPFAIPPAMLNYTFFI